MLMVNQLTGFGYSKQKAELFFGSVEAKAVTAGDITFSSMMIGLPDSTRNIIIAVSQNDSRSSAVTSLLIGGISATKIGEIENASGSILQCWIATVTSGSTANVVVSIPGTCNFLCVSTFYSYGLKSKTPTSVSSSISAPGSTSVTVPDNGFAISFSMSGEATGTPTATWVNAVEQYDAVRSTGTTTGSGAILKTAGPTTITCTWTTTTTGGRALLTTTWN